MCQRPSSRARPRLRLPSVSNRSTARDGIPFARPCPRRAHGANRWCLNLHLRAILVRPQQDAPRGVWSTMSGASPEPGPGCRDIANRRSTRDVWWLGRGHPPTSGTIRMSRTEPVTSSPPHLLTFLGDASFSSPSIQIIQHKAGDNSSFSTHLHAGVSVIPSEKQVLGPPHGPVASKVSVLAHPNTLETEPLLTDGRRGGSGL